MTDLINIAVSYRSPAELTPNPHNPKQHPEQQVQQIADSMRAHGCIVPILVDEHDRVIAGDGRLAAGKLLGLNQIPVICVNHLTDDQKRAYAIADNKLAENAPWDSELLRIEIEHLLEVNFDVTLTGFSNVEIDVLTAPENETRPEPACPLPPHPNETVSRLGDCWEIQPHLLMCTDCRDRNAMAVVLDGERIALAFLDPPYNVPISGHVRSVRSGHTEFPMASGEKSREEFEALLFQSLSLATTVTRDGGVHMICMDWRHQQELLATAEQIYTKQLNLCVWAKTNGGMGSLYRSQHELIGVFKCGTAPHTNNVELGRNGRNRTNVWNYPGVNAFGEGRDEALAMHPTVKPVALVADAILDVTHRGDAVFDGFAGSGTTLLAAHQTARVGYGMELDPRYVDVALQRLRRETGIEPKLAETGETFEAVAERRLGNNEVSDIEEASDE